ncbi:MAG: DUF1553 domain-containing protein [Planctomycetales bacterium]|nr:DUF1553 domain-containing protein [Planctomycetales bacterium]
MPRVRALLLPPMFFCAATAALVTACPTQMRAQEWKVSPTSLRITDAFDRHQLLVETESLDLTRQATYESLDSSVVGIDDWGRVTPLAQGSTRIVVRWNGEAREIPVVVSEFSLARPVSFANEIEPLLTRQGCNAGGCHGKASGQNGFRLSLFGFDAEFDHEAIVKSSRGRRIDFAAPRESLLLTKAIAQLPHGGGQRIEPGSDAYELLLTWIRQGAPLSEAADSPTLTSIEIEPTMRVLQAGQAQQLRVIAVDSSGQRRDVTRQTEFASNLAVVASVDSDGYVTTDAPTGEATIMARYMGQVAVFHAIRPYGESIGEIESFEPINDVDRLVAAKWRTLGLRPSDVCGDSEFLRRVTIDLAGRLPTVEETREFLADSSLDKRQRCVDRLLDSPDYPAYFALKWSAILRNSRLAGSDKAAYAFHNWIKDNLARNVPYDDFVRGIVAASGEWQDAPAINWYWQSRDDQLHMVTADTAQLFLGLRLQCARCHHHPYERWGQEDYYGLAGFFARLGRKSFGEPPPYFNAPQPTTGERNPLTGRVPEPKFLDGPYAEFAPEEDPRHALVDWMARPENPFFARAFVNRMWAHFFSIGLVHELDDMRETNPPSNPELLDYLASEFQRSGFNMKELVRLIVSSRVYQLSSEPIAENVADTQNFARFYARRMIAEVMLDAVDQACGTRTQFGNMSSQSRAIDLPHEGFGSYFMDTFDRPQRVSVCECERSPGATLAQVLLMANSDEIENKLADGSGRIAKILEANLAPADAIDEIYLAALNRFPDDSERRIALDYVSSAPELRRGLEDVLWSLLNAREFAFNR